MFENMLAIIHLGAAVQKTDILQTFTQRLSRFVTRATLGGLPLIFASLDICGRTRMSARCATEPFDETFGAGRAQMDVVLLMFGPSCPTCASPSGA